MKNDFCVEEMMETQFPQFGHHWRNEHVYGEVEAFDIGAIEDWFQRCIEDMGVGIKEGFPCDWALMTWEEWFKKWFSQFIEDSEE